MPDLEMAKDKVLMGSERRSLMLSDEDKKVTAYHEAGHTLVAKLIPHTDPVHKVTIIPRGMALGITQQLPEKDKYTQSQECAEAMLAVLMGGRCAEELVFEQITTGASNDIEKATEIAHKMVCAWGMSEKLGPVNFAEKNDQIFLGKELIRHKNYSEATAELIDIEVKKVVTRNYERAKKVLSENRTKLDMLAKALIEYESLDGSQIDLVLRGETLPPLNLKEEPLSEKTEQKIEKAKQKTDSATVKGVLKPGPQGV